MQNRYIVTYDITEDARRTSIYKTLRGFGDHLQYSVFRCDLSERRRTELTRTLHDLIDHMTDQILIIDLGPSTAGPRRAYHRSAAGTPNPSGPSSSCSADAAWQPNSLPTHR